MLFPQNLYLSAERGSLTESAVHFVLHGMTSSFGSGMVSPASGDRNRMRKE